LKSKRKNKASSRLTFSDIVKNYKSYRRDKRVYNARRAFFKQKEKERRKKARASDTDNPFYQILFSNVWKRKALVNKDGEIMYTPSIANAIIHIINSLASLLVAYLFIYLSYQMAVLITASFYDIDAILYYYELQFNNHSELWDSLNIIVITLSGPIFSLFLGFLFYNYLFFKAKSYPRLQLFYLWTGLLAFAHFFAAFIAGVITTKGFGYVPLWLFWSDFAKLFFVFIALISLVLLGYYSASRFLATSNNIYRVQRSNRAMFYLHQVFIPFLLGFAAITILKMPNNISYETLILTFSTFLFGAVFFHINAERLPFSRPHNKAASFNWQLIIMAGLFMYAFRHYLEEGLHFVIKFSLSITPVGGGGF